MSWTKTAEQLDLSEQKDADLTRPRNNRILFLDRFFSASDANFKLCEDIVDLRDGGWVVGGG